jgi:hypothetical protein
MDEFDQLTFRANTISFVFLGNLKTNTTFGEIVKALPWEINNLREHDTNSWTMVLEKKQKNPINNHLTHE